MKATTKANTWSRALFRATVLAMVAAGAAFPLLAEEVSGDDAMSAVAGWVRVKAALGEDFTAQPASVREYPGQDGNGKFYVVSLEGGGFVVTSGDTDLEPVIAYSKTGTWVDDVTQNPLLAMLPIDVAAASSASSTSSSSSTSTGGRRLAAAPSGKAAKWAELMAAAAKGGTRLQAGRITTNPGDLRVGKLLTTAWSQGHHSYPRVAYNYYTPTVDTDANYRFVCGCVATAGGQIMYYHQWPQSSVTLLKNYTNNLYTAELGYQKPAGGAYEPWDGVPFGGTYNWSDMGATSSTANKQAIGKLLRDIGISVYMDYSTSGGASRISALYLRFTDQFGYANAACKYSPSEDEWKRGILASLDAKLPVAVSVPGHAIVADGYGYQGDTRLPGRHALRPLQLWLGGVVRRLVQSAGSLAGGCQLHRHPNHYLQHLSAGDAQLHDRERTHEGRIRRRDGQRHGHGVESDEPRAHHRDDRRQWHLRAFPSGGAVFHRHGRRIGQRGGHEPDRGGVCLDRLYTRGYV